MSIGSISFWQQDQNFWARSQQSAQNQSLSSAVITQMFGATTNLSSGLSSIANGTALTRVNNQLTAAVQSALQGITGNSSAAGSSASSANGSTGSSASSSASSSTAPGSAPPPAAPASGTGTAPLMRTTSLFTLGILAGGKVNVSAGSNTTTYTSTGSDTVGDLINAINANVSGSAQVTAGLNGSGHLVITGKNSTDTIVVGGIYAANLGFGASNNTFAPTKPTATAAAASASSSSAGASSSSGASASTAAGSASGTSTTASASASRIPLNSAYTLQTFGTAEMLLAGSGVAGNILNMIA